MDLGESLTTNEITDNHDKDCYFCKAHEEPTKLENVLTDDADEDADAKAEGITFKNDSGKLASKLEPPPDNVKQLALNGGPKPSKVAAHHLIPGNESLKESHLMEGGWLRTDGMDDGNIGYDVNSKPNGIWLPGNHAVRPWGLIPEPSKQAYAFAAIEAWGCQFHDRHLKYSQQVENALDRIADKLAKSEDIWCVKAKERKASKPEHQRPLYGIKARLHTTSARLSHFLIVPVANWDLRLCTSRFSQQYITSLKTKAGPK